VDCASGWTQAERAIGYNSGVHPFTAIPVGQKHVVSKNFAKSNIFWIELLNSTILCFFNRNFETHLAQN
jgi:hypothetical protein